MKTLNFPVRNVRPHDAACDLEPKCAWCKKKIPHGAVCTRGSDMGKTVWVCGDCLPPPQIGERPSELTVED